MASQNFKTIHSDLEYQWIHQARIESFSPGDDFLKKYNVLSKPYNEWPWKWLDLNCGVFRHDYYIRWIQGQVSMGNITQGFATVSLMDGVRGYRLVRAVRKLKCAYLRKQAIRNTLTVVKPAKLVCRQWKHLVDMVTCVLAPFMYGRTIPGPVLCEAAVVCGVVCEAGSTSSEHSSSEDSSS